MWPITASGGDAHLKRIVSKQTFDLANTGVYQMKEFVLNNWYYIIYCAVYLIVFTVMLIKYIKAKKNAKSTQDIAEAREELKLGINDLIRDAETFKNFKGEEKKNYVMTRAIQMAQGLMSNEEINTYIEEQVELTDNVNKHYH